MNQLRGHWLMRWSQLGLRRNLNELSLGVLPPVQCMVKDFHQRINADLYTIENAYTLEFPQYKYVAKWSTHGTLNVPTAKDPLWIDVLHVDGTLHTL